MNETVWTRTKHIRHLHECCFRCGKLLEVGEKIGISSSKHPRRYCERCLKEMQIELS
jgi:hypothetical protein